VQPRVLANPAAMNIFDGTRGGSKARLPEDKIAIPAGFDETDILALIGAGGH